VCGVHNHVRRCGSSAQALSSSAAQSLTSALARVRGGPLQARRELAAELSAQWTAASIGKALPTNAGDSHSFVLQIGATNLALLRAAYWPAGRGTEGDVSTAILFGVQCDPAIPLVTAGLPLVEMARLHLGLHGAQRIMAIAAMPGLCKWVVKAAAWERIDSAANGFNHEQLVAVEAVARGQPRPGHSVLGHETFNAARPAFEPLAYDFALRDDDDAEVSLYRAAGATLVGINWMHDTSPESLRESAGCTASFEFPIDE